MLPSHFVAGMLSVGLMVLGAGVVSGQDYPNKPIRIVTAQPGGGSDFVARLIAQGVSAPLGQSVIVDNRGGGNGAVAAVIVAKATPDGYTLLFYGPPIWITPLFQNTPYDVARNFLPITLATQGPQILVVHPSLPIKSVKELIAFAKARPGTLNFGAAGLGGSNHLAAELFKSMAGVNMVAVMYKGSGPALNDLIGGQLQLMFATASGALPHIKSGRLRALAVTSAQPTALVPGLPTVAASGLPGYESSSRFGMFAPARTPATIITRLNQEIVRVLDRADVKEMFFSVGVETVGSSPEEFAAKIRSEVATLGKLIKDAGIRAD